MSLYRPVRIEFWRDPKVIEEMTPEDKLFFLYLLTNPNTTQIGVYRITKKQMAFDLGYSVESISCILDRFVNIHKVIRYNEKTREVAIKNWGKHGFSRLGKPVMDCVRSELKKVDDISLVEYVLGSISNESLADLYKFAICEARGEVYVRSTIRGHKEEKEDKYKEENKDIKEMDSENRNLGGKSCGSYTKSDSKCKYARTYKSKDENFSKRPSEEELEFARRL